VTRARFVGPLALAAFGAFGTALALLARNGSLPAPERLGAPAGVSESGWSAVEEEAVSAALDSGIRPATDDDADESDAREELRALYGMYHPYFVRGDFDGDGRLDFAQAFVRRDGPEPLFDVAVFFGSDGGGFAPPVWVHRGLLLSGGDLSVDRTVLVVTEDVAGEISSRWRWDPAEGRFTDVDPGSGEDEAEPWVESDDRVGTTA
jgi:hypothetical protein